MNSVSNAAWLPDQELLEAAARNDQVALRRLVNWNWSPLLVQDEDLAPGRRDGGDFVKSGVGATELSNFISNNVSRSSFWNYWLKCEQAKGTQLLAWLRKQLLQCRPDVMLRMELRRQIRQRTVTSYEVIVASAAEESDTPELTADRVEMALAVWREVVVRIESYRSRTLTEPFRRVLGVLRQNQPDQVSARETIDSGKVNRRKLSDDARVVELVIQVAKQILSEQTKSHGGIPGNVSNNATSQLEDWLRILACCIRYRWIDWTHGLPSAEFKRVSSLNLQESTSLVPRRRDGDERILRDLFNESLRDCLPREFHARKTETPFLTLRLCEALVKRDLPCELLEQLKSWSKRHFELGSHRPERAYLVLYYVCLVAAFVFHNRWISSQSETDVRRRLNELIDQHLFDALPWMQGLYSEFLQSLDHLSDSELQAPNA